MTFSYLVSNWQRVQPVLSGASFGLLVLGFLRNQFEQASKQQPSDQRPLHQLLSPGSYLIWIPVLTSFHHEQWYRHVSHINYVFPTCLLSCLIIAIETLTKTTSFQVVGQVVQVTLQLSQGLKMQPFVASKVFRVRPYSENVREPWSWPGLADLRVMYEAFFRLASMSFGVLCLPFSERLMPFLRQGSIQAALRLFVSSIVKEAWHLYKII